MIGSDIKLFAENILDGVTIEDEFFYNLLGVAKTKLEEQRVWQFLKKLNSSYTASIGVNSSGFTLPDDFALDYKVMVGTSAEYLPVGFEEQHIYRNSSGRYYIDFAQNKFFLLGNIGKADTIYFFYKMFSPVITEDTEPVFPERFHPILGYYVAAFYMGAVEYDDIWAKMSPENKVAGIELERAMKSWDTSLALRAQNHQIGVANTASEVDVANM